MAELEIPRRTGLPISPIYRFADWKPDPGPVKGQDRRLSAVMTVAVPIAMISEFALIWLFQGWLWGSHRFIFSTIPCFTIQSFQILVVPIFIWNRKRQYFPTEKDLGHLVDLPKQEHQFFAVVSTYNGMRKIGIDRGIITVSGDMIHFEGIKTTFGLANSSTSLQIGPATYYYLDWRVTGHSGRVKVEGDPMDSKEFERAIRAWHRAKPESHQNITLPPLNREIARSKRTVFLNIAKPRIVTARGRLGQR